jgi:hypothetical protein
MRFNTNEDSYDNLPRMLRKIVDKNPGSYYDVLYFPNSEGSLNILQRVLYFHWCLREGIPVMSSGNLY